MTVHVSTHPSQGEVRVVEGGKATILSVDEGAMLRIETADLTPGFVYTMWAIIVNDPSNCATSPCTSKDVLGNTEAVKADVVWADGGIANEDGSLILTGWVPANDTKGTWYGRGLTNPTTAEMHIVVNAHGAVLPGREAKMLTSYREGCTDESLPPPFPDSAKADGAAGENKCALVQFSVFQQNK
jgi:hypothetical protein